MPRYNGSMIVGTHMSRTDDSRGMDSDDQSDFFYTYDWYKWLSGLVAVMAR